jgi:phosphomethylpyrimidine synthase
VRISKEIQEFASGKAEGFERMGGRDGATPGAPKKSAPLTPEQQEILAKRGVLSPEEIHRLAAKTKKGMSKEAQGHAAKLSCHSDYVDPESARQIQAGRLVQVNTAPAHNLPSHDPLI